DESSGSGEQTFVNAGGQFRHRGIAAIRCDNAEGFNHSRNCAEQSKQGRKIGQSSEDTEEALQFGYFQLTGFLDDFAQFRSREIIGHCPPSSAFCASSQARAGGRQCDLTTSEHQSMAQLVFNRRKQRERRLLSFSEVEGRSSASPASQSSALQASPSAGGRIFCFFVTFVWFVTSVSSVTGSARRFGRGVFPRHRKSSNRSDARRRRSEKRSCRSRSGLWPDAFPRPGDYCCRICFAG